MKADVAVRRLERLEKESDLLQEKEHKANLTKALEDKTKIIKLVVDKWFVDTGFVKVWGGCLHPRQRRARRPVTIVDACRERRCSSSGWYRARRAACGKRRGTRRAAQQVRRAAALTAELVGKSENKVLRRSTTRQTCVASQPNGTPSRHGTQAARSLWPRAGFLREQRPGEASSSSQEDSVGSITNSHASSRGRTEFPRQSNRQG